MKLLAREIHRLMVIRDRLGPLFGTEDICLLLYSLIRMERPKTLLEIGTGIGVCAAWMAQGLKENGEGHLYTIDNGNGSDSICSHLRKVKKHIPFSFKFANPFDLQDYLTSLFQKTGVADHLTLYKGSVELNQDEIIGDKSLLSLIQKKRIDLLFCDFSHGPEAIMDLLAFFLPLMSDCSSIFIDSAPTHLPSYLVLERVIRQLNDGKMPHRFLSVKSPEQRWKLFEIVTQRTFRLIHLIERKDRPQNSTAWIRIEPTDWLPHPACRLH